MQYKVTIQTLQDFDGNKDILFDAVFKCPNDKKAKKFKEKMVALWEQEKPVELIATPYETLFVPFPEK